MKEKTVDKIASGVLFFFGLLTLTMFVLLCWGFVEIIHWITAK